MQDEKATPDVDAPVYAQASTEGLGRNAFDIWRDTILFFYEPDPWLPEHGEFAASGSCLLTPQVDFVAYRSRLTGGVRSTRQLHQDGNDDISIGLVFEGTRQHDLNRDGETTHGPSQFYAYDAGRPSRVLWSDHAAAYMNIRRADIAEATGGKVPDAAEIGQRLTASRLAPFVRGQFELLSRGMATMDSVERAVVLGQTKSLLLSALRHSNHTAAPELDARQSNAFYVAAMQFIESNVSRPNLTAERIAFALGCSRATLYRAFEAQGQNVADTVTRARLSLARAMVLAPQILTNEAIATVCGYADVRTFHRAFRRHFGVTPGEMRNEASRAHS